MKRKTYLSIFLILFVSAIFAQNVADGLLFSKFEKGLIKYKNGSQTEALVNYNTLEEEFLFVSSDNTILGIANPQDIDMIVIGNRTFVPAEADMFYEMINAGTINFFVQWKSKMVSQGKKTAYGGYSGSSSISNVGIRQSGSSTSSAGVGIHGRLISDEQFKANTDCIYYLVIDGKYRKFTSQKTFLKLFKNKQAEIKQFVTDNKIKFDNPDDVARLIVYVYNL